MVCHKTGKILNKNEAVIEGLDHETPDPKVAGISPIRAEIPQ